MNKKEVLCVMATCSDENIVRDQIDSIFWGIESSVKLIIVNDGKRDFDFFDERIKVIRPKGTLHNAGKVGFKVNEGFLWAMENNIYFEWAMVLDDDALILNKGIDHFVFEKFEDKDVGMIAVKDDVLANIAYSKTDKKDTYTKLVKQWLGCKDFSLPKEFAFYAVNFQSYSLIRSFYENNLLTPDKEVWPYPCETFQTIFTDLLGYKILFHGQYPDNLLPPLYVMHHGSVTPPDPRKISNEFLIHHSIRKVKGVKEEDIRAYYRKIRKIKYL